jgi:hypothetical protein
MIDHIINLKRGLDKYVKDNLTDVEGIPTSFEGLPFDNLEVSEWIQPRIMGLFDLAMRNSDGQASFLYQVDVVVKKSGATSSDRVWQLKDKVKAYFLIGKDIFYAVSGTTLCRARVRELVNDLPLPESETHRHILAWDMDLEEV